LKVVGVEVRPRKPFPADERRALVARVLASPYLLKSARLKEFLTYVTERSMSDPVTPIGESEIADHVFGRIAQEGEEDSIVRVHASQLRKRLALYFEEEGASESLILEIPKGNYVPLFRARTAGAKNGLPGAPATRPGWIAIATAAAVLSVVATGWLLWENFRPAGDVALPASTNVSRFWQPFLNSRLPLDVVMADSNVALLQNLVNAEISVTQYAERDYQGLVNAVPAGGGFRDVIRRYLDRRHTSMADVNLARRISSLAGTRPERLQIMHARDFQSRLLMTDQVILLGSKDANPWAELFEDKMNFQYSFPRRPPAAMLIRNLKPKGNEENIYRRADAAAHKLPGGYCVLARLPNLSGRGKVLLIAGTEMEATEAGGDFLLNETSLGQLRQALGLSPVEPFPDFEALLGTRRVGGTSPQATLIAVRRH
jgi:hypothetical protein